VGTEGGQPHSVGLVVNPIAGMGGRVGLKGTDDVADRARALGAEPVSPGRAREMLLALRTLLERQRDGVAIHWLTVAGPMGEAALRDAGFEDVEVVCEAAVPTRSDDTVRAVERFVAAGAELILFCGGDGTARDVSRATRGRVPVLGVPSGVKMYSGVFGVSPARTAEILLRYLEGDIPASEADVLDLDEEAYRRGEWVVRLCTSTTTPHEPALVQSAKVLISESTDRDAKDAIAAHLQERIGREPDTLWLLGPGSTVAAIATRLELDKTLLGVDAVRGGEVVARDPDERELLALLDRHPRCRLVLSPIGAQGFVLGRGNQQLSPAVIRRIGREAMIVVATPSKLATLPCLRFDTGDAALDADLARPRYWRVVTGYHRRRLVPIAT
jgi:predicted polyphosphate/ATP-dependent NAD kinase